jgi:hypothetical protein
MSLPSSGQLSMSQINLEAGFSSNQLSSSTQQRTFDYGVAGVNQNLPYSFSEFYGKTFTYGNSITLYYYYPWDGGAFPNNYAIWGWHDQASAEAHVGYGGYTYTHTCYYNGTLGNGTDLFINPDIPGTKLYPLVDAGFNDIIPGNSGSWYYLTDGTNSWTCQSAYTYLYGPGPTPESHTFQITNLTPVTLSGYNYEVQLNGSGTTYIITPTDFDPVIGHYYHLYAPSVLGTMNGSNCWLVLNANFYYPDGDGAFTSDCYIYA